MKVKFGIYFIISRFLCILTLILGGCDNSSQSSHSPSQPVKMEFTRIPNASGLDAFQVDVYFSSAPDSFSPIISTGTISDQQKITNTHFVFLVTPERTGEYPVTVNFQGKTYTQTALVLSDVDMEWGQPMSVAGLVNTAGYEDGVTITPDGEYLFVQTGPYRMSALWVYNEPRINGGCGADRLNPVRCDHPWINELYGPYTAPERPGFFAGRFNDTQQRHNAASWGLNDEEAPVFAMTTMFYGFMRQADGSFGQPFYLAFDDLNDGLTGPYGLSFLKQGNGNNYLTIFSLKDAFTTNGGFDVYQSTAQLGANNVLGHYELSSKGNPPNRSLDFSSSLIDFGDNTGTQGNPFLYTENNMVKSIWVDDEYDGDADSNKVSVYILNSGSFPTSTDWSKVSLPDVVNVPGSESRQPSFVDNTLFYTRDVNVSAIDYLGVQTADALINIANWSNQRTILTKDSSYNFYALTQADVGKITAIGEPTIAHYQGKTILYFVYGYIRGIDPITGLADFDMQAGYIEKRTQP